jgi:hypothetical protein
VCYNVLYRQKRQSKVLIAQKGNRERITNRTTVDGEGGESSPEEVTGKCVYEGAGYTRGSESGKCTLWEQEARSKGQAVRCPRDLEEQSIWGHTQGGIAGAGTEALDSHSAQIRCQKLSVKRAVTTLAFAGQMVSATTIQFCSTKAATDNISGMEMWLSGTALA